MLLPFDFGFTVSFRDFDIFFLALLIRSSDLDHRFCPRLSFFSKNSAPAEAASLPTFFNTSFAAGCFNSFAIFLPAGLKNLNKELNTEPIP